MELLRDLLLASIGPLGIFLGWWLPRRDKTEDRTERKLNLRREKAEEIYKEIELASLGSQRASSQAIRILKPGDEPLEPVVNSIGKLRGLIAIYFPSGNHFFVDYDKKGIENAQWLRKQLESGPNKSLPGADTIRTVTFGHVAIAQTATVALLTAVRQFMDEEVKSLI